MQVSTSDSLSPKSTALRLREFVNDIIDSTILCSLRMYERDRVLFDGQANRVARGVIGMKLSRKRQCRFKEVIVGAQTFTEELGSGAALA